MLSPVTLIPWISLACSLAYNNVLKPSVHNKYKYSEIGSPWQGLCWDERKD